MSDLNDDFVVNSNTPSLGDRLQQARENKKLSVGEVATQLRLTKDIVIHLETQQWDKLNGRTYARGYFVSYVKFLGLPQEEMLAVFNDEYKQIDNEPRLVNQKVDDEQKSLPWLMIIFLLVGAFIVWSAYQQWQSNTTNDEYVTDDNQTNLDNSTDTDLEHDSSLSSSETLPENETDALVETDNSNQGNDSAINSVDATNSAEAQTTSEPKQNVLAMSFSGDCWVKVTDTAMNVLLSQVMKAKQSIELKSELPMKVLLGKADVADITYNNEPVDLKPYIHGNVAKLTLGAHS